MSRPHAKQNSLHTATYRARKFLREKPSSLRGSVQSVGRRDARRINKVMASRRWALRDFFKTAASVGTAMGGSTSAVAAMKRPSVAQRFAPQRRS